MSDIENELMQKIRNFQYLYNAYPRYLICDIDTRFELLKSDSFIIGVDGSYKIHRMHICIIDGLIKKTMELKWTLHK